VSEFSRIGTACFVTGRQARVTRSPAGNGYRVFRSPQPFSDRSVCCDFSPDGQLLVLTHQSGMRIWDVKEGKESPYSKGDLVSSCSFHPNGTNLFLEQVRAWRNGLSKRDSPDNS